MSFQVNVIRDLVNQLLTGVKGKAMIPRTYQRTVSHQKRLRRHVVDLLALRRLPKLPESDEHLESYASPRTTRHARWGLSESRGMKDRHGCAATGARVLEGEEGRKILLPVELPEEYAGYCLKKNDRARFLAEELTKVGRALVQLRK